jgi:hypothetical protein
MRVLAFCLGLATVLVTASPTLAQSDNSFECRGGSNMAIVNACGARWEAANIRAHLVLQQYGGATPECLNTTINLLTYLANLWLGANKFWDYKGKWPCGELPAIASANDGALAQLCPNVVWSYTNRGAVACNFALKPLVDPIVGSWTVVIGPPYTTTTWTIQADFTFTNGIHNGTWSRSGAVYTFRFNDGPWVDTVSIMQDGSLSGQELEKSGSYQDVHGTRS